MYVIILFLSPIYFQISYQVIWLTGDVSASQPEAVILSVIRNLIRLVFINRVFVMTYKLKVELLDPFRPFTLSKLFSSPLHHCSQTV